jgi:uncharacterized protein DUF6599
MKAAALTVTFALLLLACTHGPADPSTLLPPGGSGWTKTGEARSFAAADLWRYLDGGAETYVSAGVRRTVTADYRYRDQIEAVADIHQFASAAGARTMMDAEPTSNSQTAQVGDAARVSSQALVFRRGPYLVRLVAYQDTPETKDALVNLAREIEKKIQK